MDNLKPLVVVLSRNYSTGLGIIRSLGEAGYMVDLVASVKKKGSSVIASSSKYLRKTVEVLAPKIQEDSGEALIKVLMEYVGKYDEKIVLLPTDDFTTSVIDLNRSRLEDCFIIPKIMSESIKTINDFMDKSVQLEIAEKAGLKIPLKWIVPINGEIIIPQDIVYPCFVKPLHSNSGHKTEMAICNNERQLKKHLFEMKAFNNNRSVLLEEFLNIDKEYDLEGVCLGDDVIIPAIIEKTKIASYERGVALSGKVLPADVLGDTIEKIKTMLREYQYFGMFDIDLNLCGEDIYFGEVNLRSGGLNFAYYLSGVNLPAIYVSRVTGKRMDKIIHTSSFGHTFVYEKVAWEDYIHKYISKKELKKCIQVADYTLLDTVIDPKPGKIFNIKIRFSLLKNRINFFLKKENRRVIDKSNADVIVTGRNYCNILTMVRALSVAGYSVDVLRVFKTKPSRLNMLRLMKPEAHSKYVKNFNQLVASDNPYNIVERLMCLASTDKKQLLVPVDDYLVGIVDSNLDELGQRFYVPSINDKKDEINLLMNKSKQKKIAEKIKLPLLKSVFVKSEGGVFNIPYNTPYPCFIKPNISMNSTKSHMKSCHNQYELRQVLTEFAEKDDFEMLVEEFADIKSEYSLLGCSMGGKVVAPCMFKVIDGGHKERKGVAITGEIVSCQNYEDIVNKCIEFVESLSYNGLFDIDLIETYDGNIFFIEINFRAGASMYAFTDVGINLAGIMADSFIKGRLYDSECAMEKVGTKFISEKLLLEELARGDIEICKIRKSMAMSDVHFIKDRDDPKPYRYFKRFYIIAILMRVLYRIKGVKS